MQLAVRKVLVVDAPKEIEQIVMYFDKPDYQAMYASDGAQALMLFDKFSPELMLLGQTLPDMSGEDICQTIRSKSQVPIIVLSSKTHEHDIIKVLSLGADDYVSKPINPALLDAKINAVLRRVSLPPADKGGFLFNDGWLSIDEHRHETKVNGMLISLTPNEFKILVTLGKNASKVHSRDELISLVIGDNYKGLHRVIDTHIKSIRKKIGDTWSEPRYIITVHGLGYRFACL